MIRYSKGLLVAQKIGANILEFAELGLVAIRLSVYMLSFKVQQGERTMHWRHQVAVGGTSLHTQHQLEETLRVGTALASTPSA